jgi:hypothetical protein
VGGTLAPQAETWCITSRAGATARGPRLPDRKTQRPRTCDARARRRQAWRATGDRRRIHRDRNDERSGPTRDGSAVQSVGSAACRTSFQVGRVRARVARRGRGSQSGDLCHGPIPSVGGIEYRGLAVERQCLACGRPQHRPAGQLRTDPRSHVRRRTWIRAAGGGTSTRPALTSRITSRG